MAVQAVCDAPRIKANKASKANVFQRTADISTCRDWQRAIWLLHAMPQEFVRPTVVSYNASLNVIALQESWTRAIQLLVGVHDSALRLDSISHNAALKGYQDNWGAATELLRSQQVQALKSDTIAYNALLKTYSAAGLWKLATEILGNLQPDLITFNTLISSSSRGSWWFLALHQLQRASFSAAVTAEMGPGLRAAAGACARGGVWMRASSLVARMKELHLQVNQLAMGHVTGSAGSTWRRAQWMAEQFHPGRKENLILHNSVMRRSPWQAARFVLTRLAAPNTISLCTALRTGGPWHLALGFLEQMLVCRFAHNRICCNAAIDICRQHGRWQECLQLPSSWDEDSSGIFVSHALIEAGLWVQAQGRLWRLQHFGVVAAGLAVMGCHQWDMAHATLRSCIDGRIQADLVSYNAILAHHGDWGALMELLSAMCARSLTPDAASFPSAMLGCEKASAWHHAIRLASSSNDLVTQNAAIAAAGRALDWRLNVEVLGNMPRIRLQPDVISYNATIDGCEKCCRWSVAVQLLGDLQSSADELSFKVALAACEKEQMWRQLLRVLADMRRYQLLPSAWTYETSADLCETCWVPLPLPHILEELHDLAQGGLQRVSKKD
ncbi:unnamed protein product [Durusdinium trenchii]|uniref:Pentatricopeptide repeat-containing protein, chloroplastic n=1 Tax=Durusdinium trenchii TaxID=1381693 RepID=A0ABP0ICG7_9DINO